MKKNYQPEVICQMLIRQPPEIVFEAFVNPEITKKFWFTDSSGNLEEGKTVVWKWEMYGVSAEALVKEVVKGKKILIDWGEPPTSVVFLFTPSGENATYVEIKNYGFRQQGEELIREIADAAGGFTTVLDAAKAWLEHGIRLNLVADKFPNIQHK